MARIHHDKDGLLITQEPLIAEQYCLQIRKGRFENWIRKFNEVQILEGSKGITPRESAKI
jgi:hypothetical protein